MTTYLLSDKPYPDLRRILMNRVYLSFKRRSKDFSLKLIEIMGNGEMGRIRWTIPFIKGLLGNNKNLINAIVINRVNY